MKAFEKWNNEFKSMQVDYTAEDLKRRGWRAALRWVLSLSDGCMCGEHLEIINNQIIEELKND